MLDLTPLDDRTAPASLRFAVVGDYGAPRPEADQVAALVRSWAPDAVVTTGDNNYPVGAAETIEANVGARYREFFAPAADGGLRFLPSLGNHDWDTPGAKPYLDYFTLPGNERYYTARRGPVEFFVLDSDPREPDGVTADSPQAAWLRGRLAESTAPWKVVALHHAPYSSGAGHGSTEPLRWPFREWGASAVLAGHEHNYERLDVGGVPYFVNGAGGAPLSPDFAAPLPESKARFGADHGAMLVDATDAAITFRFVTRAGREIDAATFTAPAPPAAPPADDGTRDAGRVAVGAGDGGGPAVEVRDGQGRLVRRFFAFDPAFRGGVRVAVGDVNRDGIGDVVTTPGRGGGPHVRVWDGATGAELASFFAYDPAFRGGVNVAAADVDGDGAADVITAPAGKGGPHVRAFSGTTGAVLLNFFAFDPGYTGGVTVAAGDFDGDARADVVAAAAAPGGTRVRVFAGATGAALRDWPLADPDFAAGAWVATVPGTAGRSDVVAGAVGGRPRVRVSDGATGAEKAGAFAYAEAFRGGVRVGGGPRVVVGAGPGGGPHVRLLTPALAPVAEFFAFEPAFRGGVYVALG